MHTDIASILADVAAFGIATATIEAGRAAIAQSNGTLTWCDAGDTWCRIVRAPVPGSNYPAL